MILSVAMTVGRNMRVEEPHLSVLDGDIRLLQLNLSRQDAFDLGSFENNPRLVFIEDVIFVERLTVGRDIGALLTHDSLIVPVS